MNQTKQLQLVRVLARRDVLTILDIINTFSGLISDKSFVQSKECHYYIILCEETPIGVIGYRPLNGWTAEQINTVILPKYRGQGLGSQASSLMTHLLRKQLGFGKVFCTVKTTNKRMIHIKKKQGFELEGYLKNHFGPGRDVYLFSKS